jgi:hypothetical protein
VSVDPTPVESPAAPAAVAATCQGLGAPELLAVLAAVFSAGARCCHWCACVDTLGPVAAGLPADLSGWSEGRAWGAHAEVRWQQDPSGPYSALYLGTADRLPPDFLVLGPKLRAAPGEPADGLFLWGTRDADGRFRSPRLPHALEYPGLAVLAQAADAPEARVPYERLLAVDGTVRFLRLTLPEQT